MRFLQWPTSRLRSLGAVVLLPRGAHHEGCRARALLPARRGVCDFDVFWFWPESWNDMFFRTLVDASLMSCGVFGVGSIICICCKGISRSTVRCSVWMGFEFCSVICLPRFQDNVVLQYCSSFVLSYCYTVPSGLTIRGSDGSDMISATCRTYYSIPGRRRMRRRLRYCSTVVL